MARKYGDQFKILVTAPPPPPTPNLSFPFEPSFDTNFPLRAAWKNSVMLERKRPEHGQNHQRREVHVIKTLHYSYAQRY